MSVRWLAVVLFIGVALLSAGSSAAQGSSTLTVHARYCEPGVIPDDPYLECHDNLLTEWGVSLDGPEPIGETDADGNLSLDGLDAGDYVVSVQAPLKGTTYRVYCSVAGGDGAFLDLSEAGNGMSVPVPSGVEVICDWYWLISDEPVGGESAPLEIHARICPTDQIPDDFFATCHDEPLKDIGFTVDGTDAGVSGPNGNLIVDVSTGTIALGGGVPGEFARTFVYCSNLETEETVLGLTEVTTGSVTVEHASGGTVCDWYVVPEDLHGETPTATPDDDDEPVTQLPNTGAGSTTGGNMTLLATVLLVGLIALASSAVVVARPRQ